MGSYVALSELKTALGISGSTEDDFLNLAIDSSEKAVDNLCGRYFTQDGSTSARTYRAQPYYAVTADISTATGLVVKPTPAPTAALVPPGVVATTSWNR